MNPLSLPRRQLIAGMLAASGGTMIGLRTTVAQSPLTAKIANDPVKIAQVRAIATAPDGIRLVVVKVETDQPGQITFHFLGEF